VDVRSLLFYDDWLKEALMPNKKPTHEQAQLQLQLYDLRREAKLRQARDWFNQNFFAESFEDCMRVAPMGSQEGTYLWMVLGYWDQACALLNNGLLHEELFFQTAGEFFGVWERVKAMVPSSRQMFHQKLFLLNLEQAAKRFEKWMNHTSPGAVEAMRQWMKQMRTEKTKKASA
jgi:hypothetical protein